MKEIQNLLSNISLISKKYEEIAKITGENFNVFRILNLESSEVRLHSAFLCELLNPNGNHGQKEIFLDLFLKQLKKKFQHQPAFINLFDQFDSKSSIASSEIHTGYINSDGTEGGRIDILIKDKTNNPIIIENKIYAGDQSKQLVRYNNAFKEKKAPIFYLTLELDENKPSKESYGELIKGNDFVCISYKEDIIEWLEQCRKEAATHSILRETLSQYINLIKHLTNQTMSDDKKNDIVDQICASPENIKAAEEICKNIEIAKQAIFFKYFKGIEVALKEKLYKTELNANFGQEGTRFCFYKENWAYRIAFICWKDGNFLMGVYRVDAKNSESNLKETIEKKLSVFTDEMGRNTQNALKWGGHPELQKDYVWLWQYIKYHHELSWSDKLNGESTKIIQLIENIGITLEKQE